MFKCLEQVIYKNVPGIIIGKRYWQLEHEAMGRYYDLKIENRIVRDIPEHLLHRPPVTV